MKLHMQNRMSNGGGGVLFGVFILSVSLFTYQVALTRLYSAILSHHYVFLTTSFAILGVGVGSVLAYRDRARLGKIIGSDPAPTEKILEQVGLWSFILSGGFVLVFVLIYLQPFVDNLFIYIVLGIIPFVISGYLFSTLFRLLPQISGKLYFADMIGAGAGSAAIVFLLNGFGMYRTAVLICLLPLLVANTFYSVACNKRKIAQLTATLLMAICVFLPAHTTSAIEQNFYALLNNEGKTFGEMQRAGHQPEIVFSRWDSFARTDLIRMPNIPELKILTIDGSANAPMYAFDGSPETLARFTVNTGYIPFEIGPSDRALIIGAGGGRGVLYALASGSTEIAAVEINPASIQAARLFGDFNGNIFDRPEVRVYPQDGRNFVRTTDDRFDVIFLSLVVTNTTQGVGFALSENYIHTVEAMEDYLSRLTEDGRVAFVAHDQLSLVRLTSTAIQALVNRGVPLTETPGHMALYFHPVENPHTGVEMIAPAIVVKNRPFTEEEGLALEALVAESGFAPGHIPQAHEWMMLSLIRGGVMSLEDFVANFDGIGPVTDNSPYFFHFERGVPAVLLQLLAAGLIGALLILIPHFGKKGQLKPSVYFGLLGMGFMMVQIPLIQMFILYLGHPTPAFSYTLAAMLISCGAGGFLSSREAFRRSVGPACLPPVIAAGMCILLLFALPVVFQNTAGLGLAGKVLIASLAVALPGFFMGMPFPRGMAALGESGRSEIIPVMWGVNGVMSVVGSVLSIILSMLFGFTAALIAGAVVYLVIGLFKEV